MTLSDSTLLPPPQEQQDLGTVLTQTGQALLSQATTLAKTLNTVTDLNTRLSRIEAALTQQIDAYNNFVTNLNKNFPLLVARVVNLERRAGELQGASVPVKPTHTLTPVPPAQEQPNGASAAPHNAAS